MISDPRDIIIAPVVSEKSYGLLDNGKYTFEVHPDANKTQVKIAIEKIFAVKVTSVNTINRKGKRKRTRTGYGQRRSFKRAIVTLSADSKPIEIFAGEGPRGSIEGRLKTWVFASTSRRRRVVAGPR
jgi:large subunit ribosomal protein L23